MLFSLLWLKKSSRGILPMYVRVVLAMVVCWLSTLPVSNHTPKWGGEYNASLLSPMSFGLIFLYCCILIARPLRNTHVVSPVDHFVRPDSNQVTDHTGNICFINHRDYSAMCYVDSRGNEPLPRILDSNTCIILHGSIDFSSEFILVDVHHSRCEISPL